MNANEAMMISNEKTPLDDFINEILQTIKERSLQGYYFCDVRLGVYPDIVKKKLVPTKLESLGYRVVEIGHDDGRFFTFTGYRIFWGPQKKLIWYNPFTWFQRELYYNE